jgi:xylulokinase
VWNQIKADVLNRTLLVPSVIEATVVGAAILATVGIGHYASREAAVAGMVHVGARFEPDAVRAAAYDALYPTYRALYAALRDSSSRLDEFASTSSGQLAATRTASD